MSTNDTPLVGPAELRARVAFVGVKLYKLASDVDVHPSRLSQYLHGRIPLPPHMAARIQRALDKVGEA
jgi:plasmid maintenance system antidote protein VapI